jgi:glycosyltransferase involved in cell wall biosynthesis
MIACMPAGSGLEQFVLERQLGYVSRAGDPQSLAAAMLACLHDLRASPQILRDMGLNGWRYARHEWTRQQASARYRDLLKEAVGDVD